MDAEGRLVGPELQRPWLFANFLAFALGAFLAGATVRALEQPYYGSGVSAIEAAWIQAASLGVSEALFGAVLGTAQWLVLRRAFRVVWWMPATTLGWALAGAVGGSLTGGSVSTIGPDQGPVPPLLALLVGYPLIAIGLVGLQWLIVRRVSDQAGLWPAAGLGGLILGLGVGFAVATSVGRLVLGFEPTDFPSAKVFLVIGSVGGLVYGALTWQALAGLSRRPRHASA